MAAYPRLAFHVGSVLVRQLDNSDLTTAVHRFASLAGALGTEIVGQQLSNWSEIGVSDHRPSSTPPTSSGSLRGHLLFLLHVHQYTSQAD